MKKTIFKGAGVAILTPMNKDGSVNYDVFGQLIDYQIENGTDAIIVSGTTGESSTLTHEEHVSVIRYCVERVGGRIPVVAGTGSNDTAYALELSREAEKAGVDGLLLVTPYYNKTSQAGLIKHYTYLADNLNTPIILYNIPSRTGVTIKPETLLELSKHPNIVAVKEASGNFSELAKAMSLCGDNLDFYSGNDDQITPLLSLGGKGVISVLSNLCPKLAHDICETAFNGNFSESAKLQLEYLDLINDLFIDVNPIPIKAAMCLKGIDVGECRMPLAPLSESASAQLKACMVKHGLIK